jgi:hypothetical protein
MFVSDGSFHSKVGGVEDAFLRQGAQMFEQRAAKEVEAGRAVKDGERARQAHAEQSRRALAAVTGGCGRG